MHTVLRYQRACDADTNKGVCVANVDLRFALMTDRGDLSLWAADCLILSSLLEARLRRQFYASFALKLATCDYLFAAVCYLHRSIKLGCGIPINRVISTFGACIGAVLCFCQLLRFS